MYIWGLTSTWSYHDGACLKQGYFGLCATALEYYAADT